MSGASYKSEYNRRHALAVLKVALERDRGESALPAGRAVVVVQPPGANAITHARFRISDAHPKADRKYLLLHIRKPITVRYALWSSIIDIVRRAHREVPAICLRSPFTAYVLRQA